MIEEIQEKSRAYNYLIYLLSKRDYSYKELQDKLKAKEYPEADIEAALAEVVEKKYQSDERYTEFFIQDQVLFNNGKYNIVQKLKQKGVSSEVIEQVLEELDYDWYEIAKNYFIHKKFYQLDLADLKVKTKVTNNMVRRGFSFDEIKYVFDSIDEIKESIVDFY